jgi:two-component system nitrogen regulation sensor histidine kinase NtrY
MTCNSLPLKISILCILIGLVALVFSWSLTREYMIITSAGFLALWIVLIGNLIRLTGKTNRDLARFLQTFRYDEAVTRFKVDRRDKRQARLYSSFNRILDAFQDVRKNKEADHRLLHDIIDHAGVAMILFDHNGKIRHLNKAFRKLIPESPADHLGNLDRSIPGLAEKLEGLVPGRQELYEIKPDAKSAFEPGKSYKVILDAREFRQDETVLKLVTLQNIRAQIEQTESDAWEKLVRIINHEIMNSVSPINLLSASLIARLETGAGPKKANEMDDQVIEQALVGLHTIKKRATGLSRFVESYRSITGMSPPALTDTHLEEVLKRILKLLEPRINEKKIEVITKISPPGLYVRADENYFEQVIINLLTNSIEALSNTRKPKITIDCYTTENELIIDISDNGPGIPPDRLEKIFMPFFTSKDEGAGIGLPFARQVMKLHQGFIHVKSDPGKVTVFTLTFMKPYLHTGT